MKIVIIDNYDSFTYNLSHLVKELGAEVTVMRNDSFKLEELKVFDKIILSPGPGIPSEAGLLPDVIRTYTGKKPILEVFHGVQTPITIEKDDYIFRGLPQEIPVGRYHSWVVDTDEFPDCLEVTAMSREGYIMALKHKKYDVHGIQFHPESVLTPNGKTIIANFLNA